MDKNAIKKYAIWARRELIERVAQRAAMYGITEKDHGDPEAESVDGRLLSQVEKRQRKALIRKIADKGYQQVIEEVAYTWFNRFAALRFMEVNGYLPTHIRVFTNDANEFKPQILSEAIHLELEGLNRNRVYELENENKREELFKYLLTVQCNALNEILPGMFQKIEDYTELLLPDNLLRQGSVIEQMITMIPEADWTDQVQIIGWLYQYYNTEPKDKVFADLKKNIKITKENIPAATQLFTPDWIVHYMVENSLGRLWLEGKSELRNQKSETEREAAEKRLAEEKGWKYYLPEAPQEPEVQAQLNEIRKEYGALKPEEIKVIDPCMGSGHILCVFFDVLVQIYEDYGYSAREAAVSIVEKNLWGLDIDNRAAQLAYFAVMMKARQYDRRFFTRKLQPHVYSIVESNGLDPRSVEHFVDNRKELKSTIDILTKELHDAKEYGSIIDITPVNFNSLYARLDELRNTVTSDIFYNRLIDDLLPLVQVAQALAQRYHIIVTNPPYMGSDSMSPLLKKYIYKNYENERYDLYAVFIQRCLLFQTLHGYTALITQNSYLYALCFTNLRENLLQHTSIINSVHLGPRAFEEISGEVVQTIATIFSEKIRGVHSTFIKLVDFIDNKETAFFKIRPFIIDCDVFNNLPNKIFAYSLSDTKKNLFLNEKKIGDFFDSKAGIVTGKDEYFLRYWQEISFPEFDLLAKDTTSKYVPYSKGGSFVKWYGNITYALKLADMWTDSKVTKAVRRGDKNVYYKKCIGWSYMGGGNKKNFSILEGCVCGTGSPTILNNDSAEFYYVLGFLNTKIPQLFIELLNPTLNTYISDICNLPYIRSKNYENRVNELVNISISKAKEDWDSFETSWDYMAHPMVSWSHGLWDVTAIMRTIHTYLGRDTIVKTPIEASWLLWKIECEERFKQLKANEEELNRIFIDIYGLQDELTPEVAEKDVTVRKADLQRDIRSFISYAVGCMFGRYSLDKEGLIFAGGNFDEMFSKRKEYLTMDYYNPDEPPAKEYICLKPGEGNNIQLTYSPDKDYVLPICDDEYFEDDIVGRFVKFVERVYGKDSLEDNLRFIADALGGKGAARDVIRSYFINDFYADHLKVYQKRPIYWLFDSGKKNAFKCLIYMHRYQPDTIARIRTDYIHEQQSRYRTAIADLEQRISGASTSERVKLSKQLTKLQDQAEELRVYEEKIHHLADQMIKIDLDDGVKVNYAKFQDVLAKIK